MPFCKPMPRCTRPLSIRKTKIERSYASSFCSVSSGKRNGYRTDSWVRRWRKLWNGTVRLKVLELGRAALQHPWITKHPPFRFFKTSPDIIRLAVILSVRFPSSLCNLEWAAPLEWSNLKVSAWLAFGLPGWRLPAQVGDSPMHCVVVWCCSGSSSVRRLF